MLLFDTILTSHKTGDGLSNPVLENKNDEFFYNALWKIHWKETNQITFIELINIGRFKHGLFFQSQTRRKITCGPCIWYFKYNILSSFEFGNKVSVKRSLFNSVSFSCRFAIFYVIESSVIVNRIMKNQNCEKLIS